MNKQQFRVLYREFLFRMVDLEVLSAHAQGDMNTLFGQFASLLVMVSIMLCVLALVSGQMGANFAYPMEFLLITTTMLVVGLFAVLSWDSTFPNRRDVLVLGPLPVRGRTIFRGGGRAVRARSPRRVRGPDGWSGGSRGFAPLAERAARGIGHRAAV